MKITEFCALHSACADGREWAVATGITTMADLWKREDMRCEWREWIAMRPGVLTDRELRLYGCWCVRQVWHLLTDERIRKAVEVSERHAMGTSTAEELASSSAAASVSASAARAWAAWASLAAGAACAAWAAWAVLAAASDAASDARAWAAWAARAVWAARDARAAQSSYLLETVHPSFDARKAAGV